MTAETPGQAGGLLDPLHALAAKWDANAARNQRNGQSLLDQGDEYGSEGLAVAEALGACVVELRAVLADAAQQPQPAPDARRALLDIIAEVDRLDEPGPVADYIRLLAEYGLGEAPHPDGGIRPKPAPELAMLTLYREALERLADEDTPVLGEGLGGGAQEELHVRASFAAHTLGRDTCGCIECLVSLELEPESDL